MPRSTRAPNDCSSFSVSSPSPVEIVSKVVRDRWAMSSPVPRSTWPKATRAPWPDRFPPSSVSSPPFMLMSYTLRLSPGSVCRLNAQSDNVTFWVPSEELP
ncbi:hypothetical protein F1642_01235 [Paracoccus sp. NBH48]|uniref:hypothetical protein n=1 Tax=Paracoccus sp. NBH48 TaxID=2596918 RepID=UPI001890D336|nr:hypothetical protein [Paracoccus sp. NBH48]MBF5077906.1 hypothetical protein [Paracoccus sp. NBH48]